MELTEDAVSGMFPDAAYLVLSSRLVPGLDGGYTIATLARARQMAARDAAVQLLTVDPADAAAHAAHRAEFVARGMLPDGVPLRNLFDEAVAPGGERPRGCGTLRAPVRLRRRVRARMPCLPWSQTLRHGRRR